MYTHIHTRGLKDRDLGPLVHSSNAHNSQGWVRQKFTPDLPRGTQILESLSAMSQGAGRARVEPMNSSMGCSHPKLCLSYVPPLRTILYIAK